MTPSVVTQEWILTTSGMQSRGRAPRGFGGDRDDLVIGTYKPDFSNTGVLPGVARTPWNSPGTTGAVGIPSSPTPYVNKDFYGDCELRNANGSYTGTWTFENCFFHGGIGHPSGNRGTVYCWNLIGYATFTDCTFSAQDPSYYRDGIVGRHYTLTRPHIYNTNDGAGAFSSTAGVPCDVIIQGHYIHDLVWWSQDPAHGDGTHNDGIQYQGGANFTARGGNVECYVNVDPRSTTTNPRPAPNGKFYGGSATIINQNTGDIASGILVEDNYFAGGGAQLQLNCGSRFSTLTVTLGSNTYGRDVWDNFPPNPDLRWIVVPGVPYDANKTVNRTTGLLTDQRFEDTGSLLTIGRTTGIRVGV